MLWYSSARHNAACRHSAHSIGARSSPTRRPLFFFHSMMATLLAVHNFLYDTPNPTGQGHLTTKLGLLPAAKGSELEGKGLVRVVCSPPDVGRAQAKSALVRHTGGCSCLAQRGLLWHHLLGHDLGTAAVCAVRGHALHTEVRPCKSV
jgi:hypothetical protein